MTVRTVRLAATTAVALLALAGCGSASGSDAKAPTGGPVGLKKMAGAIGCKASLQTDSEELRQASCTTAKATYILLTFTTQSGQRAWLTDAKPYGGSYLVGTRWVVEADPENLTPVQKELGGSVESGEDHTGH